MQFAGSHFEIKELSAGGQIEGLLAGFGDVDRQDEIIAKGSFTRSLTSRRTPLPMLLHHDMSRPIGAWNEWSEKHDGLYVKGAISLETRDGTEAHALAKAGALTGLSVGFRTKKAATDHQTGARVIMEAELLEGSLVSIPAHPRANVSTVKSISSARDIAELLREAGLSSRKAKAAAGAAWTSINQSEDDAAADAELAALITASTARLTQGVR